MSILKLHRPRSARIRSHAPLAVVGLAGMVAACDTPIRGDSAASPAPPLRETGCEAGTFTVMRGGESKTSTMQICVDGMSLRMRTSGDVVMTPDGTAVASMDADSWLIVETRAERLHRMTITPGPGGLEYEWSIDGDSRLFDDGAREWRDLMLTVLARHRDVWEVRGKAARMRAEIGSHERRVASIRREIGSHERRVASIRREIGSHERHVASLRRKIGTHERRVASLRRQVGSRERRVESLRRGMARMASAETQEPLRAWTGALERLDSPQLAAAARALAWEFDEIRLRALDEDVQRLVGDALRLREETRNEVVGRLAVAQVDMVRAEGELRSARRAVEEYGLAQRVGEVRREIERYDLAGKIRDIESRIEEYDLNGKIRDIEARIEEYDLDGRIAEIEGRIEEWDGDRRVEEIERSIRDHSAALRRLTRSSPM